MDPKEKNNSVTFNHDKVKRRKRKAETAVDNISDEPIYSHCQPAVDGKNAPQKSPTVKKTKKALRKQTNKSSPLRDLDMDVNNSDHEQKQTSCIPKAGQNLPNNFTTVKKAKTPLKKHTKTPSPLRDEGDDHDEVEQKQNRQSSSSGVVNRGSRQDDSTAAKNAVTIKRKSAIASARDSDHDMDVDNSGHKQYHTSCNQNTGKIGPKNSTTVKNAKKCSEKHTKTRSSLSDGGDDRDELEQKQNRQSFSSGVVNRGSRQVDSTAVKNAVTTKRKSAVGSLRASDHDMDVDNSGHKQYHTSCNQKTGKIGPKNSTTVKDPMKPSEKHTKICSHVRDEGDDHDELKQKQNEQSSSSDVVNRGGQDNSTAAKKAVTIKRKSAIGSLRASNHDMDVDNPSHKQYHTSCNQKTGKIGPKNSTTVKNAKKCSEKHTKTRSSLSDGGDARDELEQNQNRQSSSSGVVNRGSRQVDSTAAKNAVTTKRKSAVGSLRASDHDMAVDNSGDKQKHASCNQKTGKIGPKNSTTVKDAQKRSEKHTKTFSPLGDEGDDYAKLEQKENRQWSSSEVVSTGSQVNSTAAKTTVTTKRKSAGGSLPAASHDMDVVIPGRVEKGTYGNPKANKIGPKHSKSVEKAKKPLEVHVSTKTSSPLCDKVEDLDDDGNDEQEQHKKTRTTGGPVEKSETTTSKQNTKNVQKLPSKSKRAREGEKVFAKQQHVENPSSRRREGATVSVEKAIRHDQRHDEDIKNTATSSQPVKNDSDDENKNDEYVYRVLRIEESYTNGIYPKNINSAVRLEKHVLRGSYSTKSRFVSCCKTIDGVHEIAPNTNKKAFIRDVVRINIKKLPKEVTIIDLTDNYTRNQHLQDPIALRNAQMFEEVILEPNICIPSECIEKIGEIHFEKFYFTN